MNVSSNGNVYINLFLTIVMRKMCVRKDRLVTRKLLYDNVSQDFVWNLKWVNRRMEIRVHTDRIILVIEFVMEMELESMI